MVPEENIEPEVEEPTKRITTTLTLVYSKIIENLVGTFGKSQSAVISQIIFDWVKSNSDMLTNSYGIDIAAIRREYQPTEEISVDEQIQNRLFKDLPLRFKRIKKFNTEKFAKLLSVHPQTLIDFITIKGDELESSGLNLEIDGDFIVKL